MDKPIQIRVVDGAELCRRPRLHVVRTGQRTGHPRRDRNARSLPGHHLQQAIEPAVGRSHRLVDACLENRLAVEVASAFDTESPSHAARRARSSARARATAQGPAPTRTYRSARRARTLRTRTRRAAIDTTDRRTAPPRQARRILPAAARTQTARPCFVWAKLTTGNPKVAMPPRHMLRTKVRRFMVISIEMQGRPARARSARRRQSCCPREVCAADHQAERRRHRAGCGDRARWARRRRAMVRASSARFSSESGSAHSCVLSPNPFGACGDQIGCRSCRSTGIVVSLIVLRVERAQHGHQPVLRRAELARAFAPRLGQIDERGRHRAKIAVGVAKDAGDAIDRGCRRRVAHKMGDELRRQESRGRWMTARARE